MNKKLKSDVPTGQRRRIKGKQPPGKKTPSGKPRKKPAQAPPTDDLEEPINELSPPETVTPDPTPSECSQQAHSGTTSSSSSSNSSNKGETADDSSDKEDDEGAPAQSQQQSQSPELEQNTTQVGLEPSQPIKQQSTKEDITDPWIV